MLNITTRLAVGVCTLGMLFAQVGTIWAQEDSAAEPAAETEESVVEAAAETEEAAAEEASAPITAEAVKFMVDNLWIMLAGALVFIMHLGFATLESGLTRPKNTINILFKNVMIICIGLLTYALIGFHLMYPGDFNGYFASSAFDIFNNGITVAPDEAAQTANLTSAYADYTLYTDFSSKRCSPPPVPPSYPVRSQAESNCVPS